MYVQAITYVTLTKPFWPLAASPSRKKNVILFITKSSPVITSIISCLIYCWQREVIMPARRRHLRGPYKLVKTHNHVVVSSLDGAHKKMIIYYVCAAVAARYVAKKSKKVEESSVSRYRATPCFILGRKMG